MKVVFLFMSKSSAPFGSIKNNDWLKKPCGEQYQITFGDECYFKMLETLVQDGIITDLKIFFESNVNPGVANFVKGAKCYVVPEIRFVDNFIDNDTVIFVRGGFKHWHDFLFKYKGDNWLLLYAANTGRQRWKWWDVNFDDTNMSNEIDRYGRYQFPFIKPTNEKVFKPLINYALDKGEVVDQMKYDICIGASHIHDKKGQYHGIELMKVFHNIYGYYPSAVMPGSIRRSTQTLKMIKDEIYYNEVISPGMLSKTDLCNLYSQCKIFLHLGTVGQNDRSVIEAYACGCPVIIRNLSAHTPLLKPNDDTIFHFDLDQDPDYIKSANKLHHILDNWNMDIKSKVHKDYQSKMGYNNIAIPLLKDLFRIIKFEGKPTIRAKEHLQRAFVNFKN